ncbi:MAG: DUF99 family protein [Myxococcota bacterium]
MGGRGLHFLGIDDGPFDKFGDDDVQLVGVMMEVPELVEFVATTRFPVDGEDVTRFLADWISGLRVRDALHGVWLGGITIAGLAVIDVEALSARIGLPVMAVNRRRPSNERLVAALRSAGLGERVATVERTPPALEVDDHLHVTAAGIDGAEAARRVRASRLKSELPEPLRLAHLIARAFATGESRGRP